MKNKYPDIETLYNRKTKLEVKINFNGYSMWNVDFIGLDGNPDCQVGDFAKNFYFRTPKGINGMKYKSFINAINAIKRSAKKYGLEVAGWSYTEVK